MRQRKAKGSRESSLACSFTRRVCGENGCHLHAARPPLHYVQVPPWVNGPVHSFTDPVVTLGHVRESLGTPSNERLGSLCALYVTLDNLVTTSGRAVKCHVQLVSFSSKAPVLSPWSPCCTETQGATQRTHMILQQPWTITYTKFTAC